MLVPQIGTSAELRLGYRRIIDLERAREQMGDVENLPLAACVGF
jgi:hypothetical protein